MAEITKRATNEEQIFNLLKTYYLRPDAFLDTKIQANMGYGDQCKAD